MFTYYSNGNKVEVYDDYVTEVKPIRVGNKIIKLVKREDTEQSKEKAV
jgi:hypothetical protein